MTTIASNKIASLPCLYVLDFVWFKHCEGGDHVKKGTALTIILFIIGIMFTVFWSICSTENLNTLGEIFKYIGDMSLATIILIVCLMSLSSVVSIVVISKRFETQ